MLNIKDIQERLKRNPEPKIVGEIRELIKNSFKDIRFEPIPHKYYYPDGKGGEYELPSVSAFVEQFIPPTDWEEILQKKALKIGVDPEDLRKEWEYNNHLATSSGTVVHSYAENLGNLIVSGNPEVLSADMVQQYEVGYLFPASTKQMAARDALEFVFTNPDIYIVATETKVCTKAYCGTFDLLVYHYNRKNPEKSGLKIMDWKTNKSLYNTYNETHGVTLLEPFDMLCESPYGHYTLQQSAYQIPLEDLGLNVLSRTLIHLKDENGIPSYEFVKLPDVTKQLRNFI